MYDACKVFRGVRAVVRKIFTLRLVGGKLFGESAAFHDHNRDARILGELNILVALRVVANQHCNNLAVSASSDLVTTSC